MNTTAVFVVLSFLLGMKTMHMKMKNNLHRAIEEYRRETNKKSKSELSIADEEHQQ